LLIEEREKGLHAAFLLHAANWSIAGRRELRTKNPRMVSRPTKLTSIGDDDSLLERGRLMLQLGRHESARELLMRALTEPAEEADAMILISQSFACEKRFVDADHWASQAVAADPDGSYANYQLACTSLWLGRVKEARIHIEHSLKKERAVEFLTMACQIYLQQREWDLARACVAEALELAPGDAHCRRLALMTKYSPLKPIDYRAFAAEARELLKDFPDDPDTHYFVAVAELGDASVPGESAVNHFLTALETDPECLAFRRGLLTSLRSRTAMGRLFENFGFNIWQERWFTALLAAGFLLWGGYLVEDWRPQHSGGIINDELALGATALLWWVLTSPPRGHLRLLCSAHAGLLTESERRLGKAFAALLLLATASLIAAWITKEPALLLATVANLFSALPLAASETRGLRPRVAFGLMLACWTLGMIGMLSYLVPALSSSPLWWIGSYAFFCLSLISRPNFDRE
jgi:tetratricopeptide (TPR) repeat protein